MQAVQGRYLRVSLWHWPEIHCCSCLENEKMLPVLQTAGTILYKKTVGGSIFRLFRILPSPSTGLQFFYFFPSLPCVFNSFQESNSRWEGSAAQQYHRCLWLWYVRSQDASRRGWVLDNSFFSSFFFYEPLESWCLVICFGQVNCSLKQDFKRTYYR